MPPTHRAAMHAIAADASRQLGFSRQTITHTDAGLALLPAGDMSDLAIRMRTVRALVSTNVGGIDAAAVELTRLIDAVGDDRPLALGCLLRDRGWLNFRDGNPDQALDDLLRAYALLRRNASREGDHGGGGPPVDGAILGARLPAGAGAGRRDHRILPRAERADPPGDRARSPRRDSHGGRQAR